MSTNSFSAVVRVVTDVECKTVGQQNLVKCRAVHKYSYKDDSDVFFGLNFWGSRGSAAEKILKKGTPIFIRGAMQFNQVGDKTYIDVNVDDFSLISDGSQSTNSSSKGKPKKKAVKQGTEVDPVDAEIEGSLPF